MRDGGLVLAHGIGSVQGLPLDAELVLQTGGVVVLVSFLAVALLWRHPRFDGPVRGRTPAAPLAGLLDAPVLRTTVQALTLLVAAGVVAVGFLGPQDPRVNPAPRALYVLLWVGLIPASLLFGPVWRVLNPLRVLHRLVAAALRVPPEGVRPLPGRLGYRPAAAGLAVFTWLELVAPARDVPAVVATFLLLYGVVHTGAAVRFGAGWFGRADAFEVYSALAGSLAPIGRGSGGRLGRRNPLRGLAAVGVAPGLVALLAVWWGSTVFDGVSGWVGWSTVRQSAPVPAVLLDSVVLAGLMLLVGAVYQAATGKLAGELASTLVPIAAGYTIAHYATLLLIEGPRGVSQFFGAALGPVTAVPAPGLVAGIQIGAILVGHVVAVVAAHDRSVALLPEHRRLADQIPLVLLMVAYTMVGLFLLVIS
ncbi:hypothetical protein [Pseudonocardia acidicola]|uniref:Uncharacterized protein n=1 Tax=Pseudonocardia acidicola TaxID=2724939 RepID=A0ABX1SI75_9PSEU|nr:hypothetical protein [Pseudonocardia acidicola]NMI01274.1 hypothetical protein [Pseudonocardia acidicola]